MSPVEAGAMLRTGTGDGSVGNLCVMGNEVIELDEGECIFSVLNALLNVTDWGFCIAPDSFIFSCLIDGRHYTAGVTETKIGSFPGFYYNCVVFIFSVAIREVCVNIFGRYFCYNYNEFRVVGYRSS